MKKSSTDKLLTQDFGLMCLLNLFLFASVYLLFPILPFVMEQQVGISLAQAGNLFLLFGAALFAVGPFHAYLGDAFKRKRVLLLSMGMMLLVTWGYMYVDSYAHLLLLAALHGVGFGLAVTAGITVAIDITPSHRRSTGNSVYTWMARWGMLLGVGLGILIYRLYDFRLVMYLSLAAGLVGMVCASGVFVAFRAPMGVNLCNLDRFFLPATWLPALNVGWITFIPGLLLPLLFAGNYFVALAWITWLLVTIPFTKIFVKLCHHCQRGTADTTCHLAMETGFFVGVATACRLVDETSLVRVALFSGVGALLFFVFLTYPYFRRKRVR